MRSLALLTLLLAATAVDRSLAAQEAGALEARVWLDRGDEPVLRRGEDVRVYYRTSEDAFAAIFRIDTDGRVSLIYPQHPDAIDVVGGQRDYRLLFPNAPDWRVNEDPGVGYLFIVASPEPLDFTRFPFDERYGWDVSGVSEAVYSDPYVAIDDYVAQIVPNWEFVPYALDFVTYSVGETYSYPRFLCYDCHTYQRYSSWNPYDYNCTTYRVVIWDDPYFYPRYRYSGINVVFARPVRALPRYEVTRRSIGDAVAPIVRVRTLAERRVAEYKEPATRVSNLATPAVRRSNAESAPVTDRSVGTAPVRRSNAEPTPATDRGVGTAPVRRSSSALASPQERPRTGAAPQQAPDTARTRPTLQRRPSARLPARTPPAARGTPAKQPEPTPVAPAPTDRRAPTTRPQAAPREPQAAPTRQPVRTPPAASRSRTTEPQAAPTRAPTRPSTTREPQAAPSRPQVRPVPSRSSGQPATGTRAPRSETPGARSGTSRPSASPEPSRPSTSRPSASPQPSRPSSSRPSASPQPSRPSTSRPSASPERSRPSSSPPAASSRPPAREPESRPTVRPRPNEPNSRN